MKTKKIIVFGLILVVVSFLAGYVIKGYQIYKHKAEQNAVSLGGRRALNPFYLRILYTGVLSPIGGVTQQENIELDSYKTYQIKLSASEAHKATVSVSSRQGAVLVCATTHKENTFGLDYVDIIQIPTVSNRVDLCYDLPPNEHMSNKIGLKQIPEGDDFVYYQILSSDEGAIIDWSISWDDS